jgi:50S ribosomal subunit-associated GTPase HflX
MQKANVHKVMKEIGLDTDPDTQHLEVWNKIDLMGAPRPSFKHLPVGLDASTTPTNTQLQMTLVWTAWSPRSVS